MKKIIGNIFDLFLGSLFVMFLILTLITPEKDKFGNYTKFFRYWVNDNYLCSHFDIDGNYCNKINK